VIAISLALIAWAFASFVFSTAAFAAVGKLVGKSRASARSAVAPWPSVAILRPCEGLDADLAENLLSATTARYDGEREVFLLVASRTDPAWAIAEQVVARARAAAPSVKLHLIATEIATDANRKVAQLARARPTADVVVVADSDLYISDETLPSLVGVLRTDPKAGAASAAYLERAGETLGDALSGALLSSTPHAFFCLAGLAERSGGAHVMGGALIAIHRRVLDELGGFSSLETFLGEDFEIARRLHARGYTIPTSPTPAVVRDRGRTVATVVRRFSRWCTVTRQQRAHLFPTYVLLLGCTPLIVALAALDALVRAPLWPVGLAAAGVALATRFALASRLRRSNGLPANPLRTLAAMLAGELLIDVSALGALGRPTVEWRGRTYHVGPGGALQRLD
jgi:cellulose synthase/poly-beta-1,6-N-acetylglucosamine synthase-like glycosyltransferase